MKPIIFYSDSGFPFSVLAAAIRSGHLPSERLPVQREIENVLHTCGIDKGDASIFKFDSKQDGETCLALWTGGNGDMVERAITSFLSLYGIEEYKLVTLKCPRTPAVRAGVILAGFTMTRRVGMNLICRGIMGIYNVIVRAAACPA